MTGNAARRGPAHASSGPFPAESDGQQPIPQENAFDNQVWPTKAQPSLVSRVLTEGWSHRQGTLIQPRRGRADSTWPKAGGTQKKAFTTNHTACTDHVTCPKAPGSQRLLSDRTVQQHTVQNLTIPGVLSRPCTTRGHSTGDTDAALFSFWAAERTNGTRSTADRLG